MSSNHSLDTGYLLRLITIDEKFYHKYKKQETSSTKQIRNSLTLGLKQLATAGRLTYEDAVDAIKKREEICMWYTKMELLIEEEENLETDHDDSIPCPNLPPPSPASPPPSTEANDSTEILYDTGYSQVELPSAKMNPDASVPELSDQMVDLSKSMDFGAEGKLPDSSSLMMEMGSWNDVEEQPGSDQQTMALNLLDKTRGKQDVNETLTDEEKEITALKVTIEELLKEYKPSGKKFRDVNLIISNNKSNLKKRLFEIIDKGEHVTDANLEPVIRSISNAILPSTAHQYKNVLEYLNSAAKLTKQSKFGAIMYLIMSHQAKSRLGCSYQNV